AVMKAKINKVTIRLTHETILSVTADALVNATDPNLSLPPELAARAGLEVVHECIAIGWCDVGSAKMTGAGNLKAEKIIHAVGPRRGEGSEGGKLANVTCECLQLVESHDFESVS